LPYLLFFRGDRLGRNLKMKYFYKENG